MVQRFPALIPAPSRGGDIAFGALAFNTATDAVTVLLSPTTIPESMFPAVTQPLMTTAIPPTIPLPPLSGEVRPFVHAMQSFTVEPEPTVMPSYAFPLASQLMMRLEPPIAKPPA